VHAVGDVANGVVLGIDLRPQFAADVRGHLAVDAAHPVLESRAVDREQCHVEVRLSRTAPSAMN